MRDVLVLALLIVVVSVGLICLFALSRKRWCKKIKKKLASPDSNGQSIGSSSTIQKHEVALNVDAKGQVTDKFLSDWEASMRQQMQNISTDDSKSRAHEASNSAGTTGGKQRRSVAELQEIAKLEQQRRMEDFQLDFGEDDDDEDWYEGGEEQLRDNSYAPVPEKGNGPPYVGLRTSQKPRNSRLLLPSDEGTGDEKTMRSSHKRISAQRPPGSPQGLQLPGAELDVLQLPRADGNVSEKKVKTGRKRFSGQRSSLRPHQSLQVPGAELGDNSDALTSMPHEGEIRASPRLAQSLHIPAETDLYDDVGSSPSTSSPDHKPKRRPPRTRHSPSEGQHISQEAPRASLAHMQAKRPSARRSAVPKKPSGHSGMDNDEWPVHNF